MRCRSRPVKAMRPPAAAARVRLPSALQARGRGGGALRARPGARLVDVILLGVPLRGQLLDVLVEAGRQVVHVQEALGHRQVLPRVPVRAAAELQQAAARARHRGAAGAGAGPQRRRLLIKVLPGRDEPLRLQLLRGARAGLGSSAAGLAAARRASARCSRGGWQRAGV